MAGLDEAVDISPSNDGGVLKKITQKGDEDGGRPPKGCKVRVHYTGTLTDGTKFDSSRDRDEPFEFDLGKGRVIKAWDIGVATMYRGERAVLTCAPAYAYGASGSPPTIPPDATLLFDVEVIDWTGQDLSPARDGGIEKLQVVEGEGHSSPNDGAAVTVHVIARYFVEPDTKGVQFQDASIDFLLGEGSELQLPESVERAVESMKKGERATVKIAPKYGFGAAGCKELGVPPEARLVYDITLKTFEKAKESWSLDQSERIEQAADLKTRGTGYYSKGKIILAKKLYKKVLTYLDFAKDDDEEQKKQREALLLATHLNLALCHLKANEAAEAVASTTSALALAPDNVKALFRRGQARLALGEPGDARADFVRVLELEPNNAAARAQLAACANQLKEQKERDRNLYKNMFDKFAKADIKKPADVASTTPDIHDTTTA